MLLLLLETGMKSKWLERLHVEEIEMGAQWQHPLFMVFVVCSRTVHTAFSLLRGLRCFWTLLLTKLLIFCFITVVENNIARYQGFQIERNMGSTLSSLGIAGQWLTGHSLSDDLTSTPRLEKAGLSWSHLKHPGPALSALALTLGVN